MSYARIVLVALVLLVTLSLAGRSQESSEPRLATPAMFKEEFAAVPCSDGERIDAVKDLFQKVGANASDLEVEKFKHANNVVLRKRGLSPETIVIGAHYDKVASGCGAVDNWTGIVTVAHVFRTLRDVPLKKTVIFVGFGSEEEGLVGSKGMAGAIDKSLTGQYCAMINIDSLGLATPQVMDNASSKKLIQLADGLAKEMKMPFSHANVAGADADSSSFIAHKIPAVTIHGMSRDWASILHSRNDQTSRVNVNSVYLGYRLALAMLIKVDQAGCEDFR
jgi:Iap family predicted aminopeptidase